MSRSVKRKRKKTRSRRIEWRTCLLSLFVVLEVCCASATSLADDERYNPCTLPVPTVLVV